MEIIHHIAFDVEETERRAFLAAGVELDIGLSRSFDISESDPRWPAIEALVRQFDAFEMEHTEFSLAELKAAAYLSVLPGWHHGYPEPSDENGYLEATFDLSDYCAACGVGLRQVRPFRFAKAPMWGRRSVMQLNWIFDEYFVKPEVWSALFEPFGIGCRPVVLNKNGVILDTVVQLDTPAVVELKLESYPGEQCNCCGRTKYKAPRRGFFPTPSAVPAGVAAFKSAQYFGSGASAYRAVLVSKELYAKLAASAIKGVTFEPCT
jgi:hypothetical protein